MSRCSLWHRSKHGISQTFMFLHPKNLYSITISFLGLHPQSTCKAMCKNNHLCLFVMSNIPKMAWHNFPFYLRFFPLLNPFLKNLFWMVCECCTSLRYISNGIATTFWNVNTGFTENNLMLNVCVLVFAFYNVTSSFLAAWLR